MYFFSTKVTNNFLDMFLRSLSYISVWLILSVESILFSPQLTVKIILIRASETSLYVCQQVYCQDILVNVPTVIQGVVDLETMFNVQVCCYQLQVYYLNNFIYLSFTFSSVVQLVYQIIGRLYRRLQLYARRTVKIYKQI